MRAVAYVSPGEIDIIEKPIPKIEPDEVLLEVLGAGVCHSDLNIIRSPRRRHLIGTTLGHETAGRVVEVGSAVTTVDVGEEVLSFGLKFCDRCRECLAGRQNQCMVIAHRRRDPLGHGLGLDGGMADYMAIRAQQLDSLGGLDPVACAPLCDAGRTPMRAINSVRDRLLPDATVLVLGLGGLGHVGLQIVRAVSHSRIIAADIDEQKVAFAAEHGADLALISSEDTAERVMDETDGWGADVVLDFVGNQATMDTAVGCIATGGAIRSVGLGEGAFTFGPRYNGLPWGVNIDRFYGGNRTDMRHVLGLAYSGAININVVRYDLDDAKKAFDDLDNGRVQGRAVLVP